MKFIVTEKAQRPASMNGRCFYCDTPIGGVHKDGCVLVKKKVQVRMTVEYEIQVPSDWDGEQIESYRNSSGWCASNAIQELEAAFGDGTDDCMCQAAHFEYLGADTEAFLEEE